MEKRGHVITNSWAGKTCVPCTVIGETPKRYRVRMDDYAFRWCKNEIVLVPKYAVEIYDDTQEPAIEDDHDWIRRGC